MERLIICGGGHVSLELAYIASRLEFELVVLDDRAEFANTDRFPMAKVYAQDFKSSLEALGSQPTDYYAVITRGHAWDTECVEHILRGSFAYLGMIGSRAKVAAVKTYLAQAGFSEEEIARVHAPIGLPIGGQTPAEIAVAIAAELVQVRTRQGGANAPRLSGHGMRVTIVEKHGSAPRGVGASMLVTAEGACTGTIGGGSLEFRAQAMAREMLRDGQDFHRQSFDLTKAAELGMVCGGQVTLEFTRQ